MKLIPAIDMFKSLTSSEIEVLVDSATDAIFTPGDTVIKQGEVKNLVYIIKEGHAKRKGGRVDGPEDITTGACFGEEAFLSNGAKYASTVSAKDALTCLAIDCMKFKSSATAQIAGALRSSIQQNVIAQQGRSKFASMPRKQDLTVLNLIGVGSFGRVRLVRQESAGTYYALKCMNKGLIVARKQVQHVNNEKGILAKCSHPFVVNLVGWYQDRHELYMLFELLLGGELFSIMSKVCAVTKSHAPCCSCAR